MKIVETILTNIIIDETLLVPSCKENVLFFDIETTGLSPRNAAVYLIGVAYYDADSWKYCQWFAESPKEELVLLEAFTSFCANYSHLIHFNGTTFDVPFVTARCQAYGFDFTFPARQTDIYKATFSIRKTLNLPGCKQKELEHFLGIFREDKFDGGQLIKVYYEYVKTKEPELLKILLLHNAEDVQGMLEVFPILAYKKVLKEDCFSADSAEINTFENYSGELQTELLLTLSLDVTLPKPLALHKDGTYLSFTENRGILKLSVQECELKYFYPDFKNYSYLPDEDTVIHNSVAQYVDPARKEKATRQNCCIKKAGHYIPAFQGSETCHLFRSCYETKEKYISLDETDLSDMEFWTEYIKGILDSI